MKYNVVLIFNVEHTYILYLQSTNVKLFEPILNTRQVNNSGQ